MNAQLELYPNDPGYKVEGTSKDAALAMKPSAATLRQRALAMLKIEALTADEVAARLNESVLAIRPRISELNRMGLISATGFRRPNNSGLSAAVWTAR